MILEEDELFLPDGRNVRFFCPGREEAEDVVLCLQKCAGETEFLIRYPEELEDLTAEEEAAFLEAAGRNPYHLMLACTVEGEIAGIGSLYVMDRKKIRHRGEVSISFLQGYWGLGLGSAMMEMLERAGRVLSLHQLELTYIGGNERARRLYDRMGYAQTGILPDAVRLKDGSFRDMIQMRKVL